MSQIILIENDDHLFNNLKTHLSHQTGAEIIPRKNADEALEFLQMLPEVELIVSTDRVDNENTSSILFDYVKSQKDAPTLIVFGAAPRYETGELINIKDKNNWQQVIKVSCKLLGIPFKMWDESQYGDYVPIPIHYFHTINDTPCDVFIKIKKSPSGFRFVKRIRAGDSFTREEILRYEKQQLKELYIPKEMAHNYSNFISNHFVSKLSDKNIDEQERIFLIGEGHYIVTQEILKGGFSPAVVQLTETLITALVETVEYIPQMKQLLLKVINAKSGFLYQHSHICCAISAACIQESSIPKDKKLLQKVAFASFFQDISLADDEALADIASEQELLERPVSERSQHKVLHHALDNSEFVKQYKGHPYGADILIKHHHGSPEGMGFSTDIGRIPELSRIFAVASDFARLFLRFLGEEAGKDINIIAAMKNKYSSAGAAPTLRLLDKVIHKKQ